MKTKKYLIPFMLIFGISTCIISCNKESDEKDITSFVFNNLNPPVSAVISNQTITAKLPNGTDASNLTPTIVISDKASMSPSSGTPQDFTNPVNYTVTAEDESIITYTAKVIFEGASENIEINWTTIAESPTKRGWMPAVTLENKMYVIGGIIESESTNSNTMEVYDPATNSWDTTKSKMLYKRYSHSASVVNGKIYVMGGIIGMSGPAINNIEVYNPQNDEWAEVGAMPQSRAAHAACVLNNKIYVIGGETAEPTSNDNLLDAVEVFDPANNSWDSKAPLPIPMAYLSASAVNGKVYAIGGTSESPWDGLPTVYEYDPQTDIWTKKNNIDTQRWALSTCVVNDMIFCIGGSILGLSSGATRVEVYSPVEDKCYAATGLLTKSYAQGACIYQDKIYVFAGCNSPYPYLGYNDKAEVGVPVWK